MTENITVNTQSSIRIDGGSVVVRADPFGLTGEPHDADIILITHEHYDHFSPGDIAKVRRPDTVFAAPKSMAKKLAAAGIENAVLLAPGESCEIRGIPVEAVAAYNIMKPFHPKGSGWLGYVVCVGGKRIYIAGDTDAVKEAKSVRCDIALVPVGGTYTMNYKEAAALVNELSSEAAVPIHYGSIVGNKTDGEAFAKLVRDGISVEPKLFV
ncbi:MAG: MBL fold metallo-hydrolase [Ruminiclostridium sp.]|nr:MBL fold metallo-hydrolase [Ruminiclostridium sp.]